MRISGSRMGHVTRRLSDSGKLRIVVDRGIGVDLFEQLEALPEHEDAAWCRAVRLKQTIVIPDVQDEPSHPARALGVLPYRAELAVPLLLAEPAIEAHGALTALFTAVREPAVLQSADLDGIARQAAALVAQVT
jgi:GAF domain-containing protein